MSTAEHHDIEQTKELLIYLRHITTLSTGSIVILVTFLEKIFSKPDNLSLVVIAIACFLLSVLSSLISQTIVLANIKELPENKYQTKIEHLILKTTIIGTWVFFIVALSTMGTFAILNLLGTTTP